jgi:hypothetical protein
MMRVTAIRFLGVLPVAVLYVSAFCVSSFAQPADLAPPPVHFTTAGVAPVAGNLPPDFYPHPICVKPDKKGLSGAPGVKDQDAMLAYNLRVKMFNDKAMTFNTCIKTYIDKARNDINTIQAIVHAAVADANAQ